MKKFVLAPDSFKESMTAKEVCVAMEKGIRKVFSDAEIVHVPMADGGEGTVESLVDATNGYKEYVEVQGPLPKQKVRAYYGILEDKKTAVIEMAQASGLMLVDPKVRNPLVTTTYGTGELIKAALNKGVSTIIIGIGGSATVDGGIGMAQALGVKFTDKYGNNIEPTGSNLAKIDKISMENLDKRVKKVNFIIASDVENILTGKKGAAAVFGPQKGATPDEVELLDKGLIHYAEIIRRDIGKNVEDIAGSGAAGGLGAGLIAFLDAKLQSGVEVVANTVELAEKISQADYVFTGEGGMDFQTKYGKTPFGVAQVAKKYQKPVFAEAGYLGERIEELYDIGISAIFGIVDKSESIEESLEKGPQNVERTTENIARLISSIIN
ncbi:glycerate kinase [Ligilactobacillus salivarius]|uniref:Glycerate kinase n=1 Tax=Ligilactobacillus salivarius TaxID=1624 RepID=A0AAX3X811_9LACO|nr:glycerate kinase [Ligilactobacillus salivarius]MDF4191390.1 glycerate kinase [Ligilactobacillus salivarius]PAY54403.1 glycerate kinase [Ligilactobacillus salivarius]PAY60033.1 glycerate kinase [Ligilactobacillus salivarius]PAY64158.1 glycerate kinase [Ligilactobacillus salivarius]QXL49424.1 glycerate kinase [Ligilactobacillus salivarius]